MGVEVCRMVVDFGMRYKFGYHSGEEGCAEVVLAGLESGPKVMGYRVSQAGGGTVTIGIRSFGREVGWFSRWRKMDVVRLKD